MSWFWATTATTLVVACTGLAVAVGRLSRSVVRVSTRARQLGARVDAAAHHDELMATTETLRHFPRRGPRPDPQVARSDRRRSH